MCPLGYLIDDAGLADQVAKVPKLKALDQFTDKMVIVLAAADLQPYLFNLCSVFNEVCQR